MSSGSETHWCHQCSARVNALPGPVCPTCRSDFVELIENTDIFSVVDEDLQSFGMVEDQPQEFELDQAAANRMMEMLQQQFFQRRNDGPRVRVGHRVLRPVNGQVNGNMQGNANHPFLELLMQNLFGHVPTNLGDYAFGNMDDLITQIMNQSRPRGPPPASKDFVSKLPKVVTTEAHVQQGAQCAVCMGPYEAGENTLELPCKHLFHPDCINPWLETNNSCPVCRHRLPTDDAEYEAQMAEQERQNNLRNSQGQPSTSPSSS